MFDVSKLSTDTIESLLDYSHTVDGSGIAVGVPGNDKMVVLGMLCYDQDPQNPLEDQDGMGQIYTAHRNAGRDEHRSMQEALGLDTDWSPNPDAKPNKYAVLLDVYDHGGQVYSISGEGMQCRWDTARGGAVWVPDDCAREEVDRRAKVYAFGFVLAPGFLRTKHYQAILEAPGQPQKNLGSFEHWHEAFQALEAAKKAGKFGHARKEQLERGLLRAKEDVARGVLETYNEWLSGDVYGIVCQAFVVNEAGMLEAEGPDDSCWGFYGHEYAEQELKSTCEAMARNLSTTSTPAEGAKAQAHAQA
jgi:hypothetical protein